MSEDTLEPAVDDTGNQHTRWLQLIEMTKELKRLAQRGDWNGLNSLSARRDILLNDFFSQDLVDDMRTIVQKDIAFIKQTDEDTVMIVQKNKDLLAEEITRLQVKRKQIQSYISNSD